MTSTGEKGAVRRWRPLVAAIRAGGSRHGPGADCRDRASRRAWQAPGYERTIGGTGTAGVYAWGIAYDAATNQLEVSDYWNFFVRSYSMTGQQVASFYQSASTRQGQPESIAVDPRNGNIWVAENGTQKTAGYIAEFSDTGTYLGELNTRSEYTAWIAMDGSGRPLRRQWAPLREREEPQQGPGLQHQRGRRPRDLLMGDLWERAGRLHPGDGHRRLLVG